MMSKEKRQRRSAIPLFPAYSWCTQNFLHNLRESILSTHLLLQKKPHSLSTFLHFPDLLLKISGNYYPLNLLRRSNISASFPSSAILSICFLSESLFFITLQYPKFVSVQSHLRSNASATAYVVPEPPKGSTTSPSRFEEAKTHFFTNSIGF